MQLIHTRSYADVGVQELCAVAKVKKGSFYHFFESKQALALAALDAWWVYAQKRNWDVTFVSALPPMRRIEQFFENNYEQNRFEFEKTGRFSGCPFGNLSIEMCHQDEEIRGKIEVIFNDIITRLQHTLDDAIALGDLAPMDTRETALALWAYCEGVQMLAKARQDLDLLRRLGQRAVRFLQRPEKHTV